MSRAVDAIERGIVRGSARVWAPRFVGAALALRGLLQPLSERRVMRSRQLAEALELAEPGRADTPEAIRCWESRRPPKSRRLALDTARRVVNPPQTLPPGRD